MIKHKIKLSTKREDVINGLKRIVITFICPLCEEYCGGNNCCYIDEKITCEYCNTEYELQLVKKNKQKEINNG